MNQIIAIINQKGGVGKTTAAGALGAGLRRHKYKVLTVDLDPQSNLSLAMRADENRLTVFDLLTRNAPAAQVIQHTPQGDLIPASADLAAVDQVPDAFSLTKALQPVRADYDFVIIDTPPTLNILTLNALTAATSIIITTKADLFSLQGITQLEETIAATRHHTNPGLKVSGLLLAYHKPQTLLVRTVMNRLRDFADRLDTRLYKTAIRDCIVLQEAQIAQQDIFTYKPNSNAAADYAAFTKEFLKGQAK
jgi:chromosome partitioning protein